MGTFAETSRCPVCLLQVDTLGAIMSGLAAVRQGRNVYFCSWEHRERFEADPQAFALPPEPGDELAARHLNGADEY